MIKHLRVTVDGKAYDVVVEELGQDSDAPHFPTHTPSAAHAPAPVAPPAASPAPAAVAAAPSPVSATPSSSGPNDRTAPLAGVVVEINVAIGDVVAVDQQVAVLEAMKMKSVIGAHKAGRITAIYVATGDGVEAEQPMMTIE
jgi:glutaconyl-CoA/methylmalonyl-CoA decarboxylase subunit gamma